jgi:hypothetical protein
MPQSDHYGCVPSPGYEHPIGFDGHPDRSIDSYPLKVLRALQVARSVLTSKLLLSQIIALKLQNFLVGSAVMKQTPREEFNRILSD